MTILRSHNSSVADISLLDIRNMRNSLSHFLTPDFNKLNIMEDNRKIIIDALVYMEFKGPKNIIFNKLSHKDTIFNLIYHLSNIKALTFQNVINTTVELLNLEKLPDYNIEKMLNKSNIENYPSSNLAIRIYLLKGKIVWNSYPSTQFSELIFSEDAPYKITDSTVLNCWEAVLYAMLQANIISIRVLQKCYEDPFFLGPLIELFDYPNSKKLTNLNFDKLESKPYLIMLGDASSSAGLNHDMLSVPFSQKQILRMLITQSFDEKPSKIKLFSHWTEWTNGTLGSVKKDILKSELSSYDYRIKSIENLSTDINLLDKQLKKETFNFLYDIFSSPQSVSKKDLSYDIT